MMKIENILVEHFSRLKCANFFILFDQNFADVSSVRVHLRPTEIHVHFDSEHNRTTTIDLSTLAVRIQINSLSLLIVKENLMSFRINIASYFREEILPLVDNAVEIGSMKQLRLNVDPQMGFHVICDNCSGPLSDLLCYRRILELPSEHMDSDDWFCHKHEPVQSSTSSESTSASASSNGHVHVDASTTFSVSHVKPAEDCLLYGNFLALFHRNHIKNVQINKHRMVHCRRCLCNIGECVNDSMVKLWNGNAKVIIKQADNSEAPSANANAERLFHDSESLYRNFLVIIDRISHDYQMLGQHTLKLLFVAHSSKAATYLFIQTMARNLEIHQMDKQQNQNQNQNNPNPNHMATMTRVDGIKCLFLCEENTDQKLVDFWQKDLNVVRTEISVGMLDAAVEHLHRLSKYVPEQFRMNNGFCLSYLSYGINS